MSLVHISGFQCEVVNIADGFARGPDGTCALCLGDPCNERPIEGSNISKFYELNPRADTCPSCEGRST